ncbi:chromosome segregation protein SMC [Asaccharospora irregularis]|uniref:Chromosome partition protein Smc n=1 Tax=Asaccharospora irregularis DSM 2635 TaxID=1121321 RepID=A0A1M5K2U6_9FIRM|nr:chromosome segregation protein SMC [Asaccharospora irregularis]SHG46859.1 condensin subunit Smc [Asaccharospora irregularis DSM 2635]
MYLKRLELKGFKSFPTKTDIIFKEGITAIVGPNGSGKSNISDAVRWVLGEQSIKSLRGDKLEDVIFAGTDNKKPMNYCEVALTIDNQNNELGLEFSEVTIKRRAYRNGESEFFLNNKSCRLKDIKEIFLDTGIGKDGYSIIEQGKVDEILSNNPANRRKVFDEACGISKYRYKKQEAERNLKNTKENLERIDDIYIEIENQLKPLFNQQTKAKKYLDLSEKLKVIEVNSFIREIEALEKEVEEVNKHIELLNRDLTETEKQKNDIDNKFSLTNKDIEDIDEVISKSIDYINSIKSIISQKEGQLNLINERLKNYNNEIDRKNQEILSIKEKIKNNQLEIERLDEDKNSKKSNIDILQEKIGNIEEGNSSKRIEIEKLNERVEFLKDDVIRILNKKQELSNKISALDANKENIKSRVNSINQEIKDINNDKQEKNNTLSSIELDFKSKQENLNNLNIKNNNLKESLENFVYENSRIEKNIQDTKYTLNDLQSKLNIYIEMENHYEGFNRGVKEVLKNKSLNGIHGAVGQIINVSSKYEKAVEAALGATMQNVITDDEQSAKVAINYLKKNNLGRVTFLPVNIIKGNKIDKKTIKSNAKYIGLASDLVSFNDKYKNIIDSILGRTIIIENIDEAIKFARETNHRFKVVTLDGEILNPGGALTGGSLKASGNILSRKRLIGEYTDNIKTLKEKGNCLLEEKEIISNNINNVNTELKVIDQELKESEKLIIMQNSNIQRLKDEIESLDNVLVKLENEKKGLDSNLSYTLEKIEVVNNQVTDIEDKHKENQENIQNLSEKLKELNKVYEDEKSNFDGLNLELVKSKQIYEGLIKEKERIETETNDLQERLTNYEKSLVSKRLDIAKLEEELVIETTEKENLKEQLGHNNSNLETKKVVKEDLKSRLEDFNKNLKSIDRQYMELKESLFKVEGKLERLRSNQETYINKLFEKYQMTFVQAIEIREDKLEIDKKQLERLRMEIRSLGNVNIDSIKEYEEVKERYDFYSEQKQDLEESIQAIERIISELEESMKSEFKIQFNAINENFKYVYKRLFGGGCGELTILDEENILESDIEITAQPPGKKMKNLNLLSGGEKALTAISVLFSILLAKPTPFCILDEIEAPLDDVNIFRFGEFLRELSEDTQFISVTHRRGTMEVADYIYGVTMQEKAISKVISLKLKEAQEITDVI